MSDDPTAEEIRALNEEIERVRADAMSDDLIARLRRANDMEEGRGSGLFNEAADVIEWLTAQAHYETDTAQAAIEEITAERDRWELQAHHETDTAQAAIDEIERLREENPQAALGGLMP